MKAISAKMTHGIQVGSYLKCADNSGATLLKVISVKKYKGVSRRLPRTGVGGWVVCTVKKGDPKMKHEVVNAVIIRQRREYRRKNGMRIKFEDNAAVLINEKGDVKATRIKGPVAKEAVERFSTIGKIATMVV
ncbi:MAG: 50S ribosomal protein L14 [Candidatus Aenigmarchaeota archaeon]|nr:50S ribosomal protein L14 [Candidatus Aenigmarchaeota archaeon]